VDTIKEKKRRNNMSMFCYQCQEASKGTGCSLVGVCGKSPEVSDLQDLLIYTVKGISEIVVKGQLEVESLGEINEAVLDSLFKTITNANFDAEAIKKQIYNNIELRNRLAENVSC
jgi:hydroxylamine reductase